MKPTFRRFLLALIILLCGAVPGVHAAEPTDSDFINATAVTCADPPTSWNGEITSADEVDYYSIDLVAGQVLAIDVDTNGLSALDSLLEVFDSTAMPVDASDDSPAPGEELGVDPYLEITVDVDGTYYLAISAQTSGAGGDTGGYNLFLGCSDPSIPPVPVEPVKLGDLLGATGSDPGSLLNINPADGASKVRFPFEYGNIADIEYDPGNKVLFVTIDNIPGRIIVVDPNTGAEIKSFNYELGGFLALELVNDTLYGVYVEYDESGFEKYTLVTIDQATGATAPVVLSSSSEIPLTRSLAYHPVEKKLYGASGTYLIKFDLTLSPVESVKVPLTGLSQDIMALDFSDKDLLYGIDRSGNLFNVVDLSTAEVGFIGEPIAGVSGLTFVVGEAPPDEEPVKTLCSSTLTGTTAASSETDTPKLSKLKLKNNPLHRAIGLFKFQGKAGERVTLRLAPEGEEAAVAGEETALSPLVQYWLNYRGKGRVFLGIRDAIPNVDFRARKKDQMPFDMSADLPEDGYYYVMVIRPLLRFYKTDYCLTIESDQPDSQAWQTLDVVWPGDDSKEDTATTSTEEKAVFESVDEGSDQVVQEVEQTTTEGTVETTSVKETTAEVTEQSAGTDAPQITEETTTVETAPVEDTAAEVTEQSAVTDASLITEETTTEGTVETAPVEETAAEVAEQPVVTDASQVIEETTVESAPLEETAAEVTEQPAVMGAPPITEGTTVDETGEVAPEASAF